MIIVHDHNFKQNQEKIYSTGGFSNEVLTRYTQIFGQVYVLSRVSDDLSASKENLSEITNKNINIVRAMWNKDGIKKIESFVKNEEKIILRLPSINGYIAAYYAMKYKKRFYVEVVGCAWDSYWNHSLSGKFVALPLFLLMKYIVQRASYVLYVTDSFLQNRYPTKGKILACSDVKLLDTNFNKKKIVNTKLKICTIGSLSVKYKGQTEVIRALAKLKENLRIDYFLIGGGNPERLKNLAEKLGVQDQIHFLGTIPHDEIKEVLKKCDLYIQPSKQEGLPRALLEAMETGVPAIGSNVGGIPELLPKEWVYKRSLFRNNKLKFLIKKYYSLPVSAVQEISEKNFLKSKEYEYAKLEKKRKLFMMEYFNE